MNQLATSIDTFGFVNPLILDETDTVLAGHGRLLAARQLCLDSAPCLRVIGLSEEQKIAFALADNRIALNSEWNEKLLAEHVQSLLEDPEFGPDALHGFGFGRDDLVRLDMLVEDELAAETEQHLGPGFSLGDLDPDSDPETEPETPRDQDLDSTEHKQPGQPLVAKLALFSIYLRREDYAEATDLIFRIKRDQGMKDSADVLLYALRTVCS